MSDTIPESVFLGWVVVDRKSLTRTLISTIPQDQIPILLLLKPIWLESLSQLKELIQSENHFSVQFL